MAKEQFAKDRHLLNWLIVLWTWWDPSPHSSCPQEILQLAVNKRMWEELSVQERKHRPGLGCTHTVIGSGCGDKHCILQRGDSKSRDGSAHTVSCFGEATGERRQRRSDQSGIKPVKLFDLNLTWIFALLELMVRFLLLGHKWRGRGDSLIPQDLAS